MEAIMNIYTSSHGHNVQFRTTLVAGQHVTVERIQDGNVVSIRRFSIGDTASHDSFNLIYTGTITSITTKNVIVMGRSFTKTTRMAPETFAARNWDFDLARINAYNSQVSLSI